MPIVEEDPVREHRITMEIVVDAYGAEEQAMGWWCYLDTHLTFPFQARCFREIQSSPLKRGEKVQVIAMAPSEDCMRRMFVQIRWMKREMAISLSQLKAIDADEQTQEAIADWHYWVKRGYSFG